MPKNESQSQRIANASPLMAERFAAIASSLGLVVPYHMNNVFFEKNDVDAVIPLREFLASTGIHNYESQKAGAKKWKVSLPADYLWVDEKGDTIVVEFTVTFYRSDNRSKDGTNRKGDPRFSIGKADTRQRISENDFVIFAVSTSGKLLLVNVRKGLGKAPIDSALWRKFLESAITIAGISSSGEEGGPSIAALPDRPTRAPQSQSGQGFMRDQKLKVEIEEYAVGIATEVYCGRGADHIEPLGKPYDLLVLLNGEEIHAEVKGSRNDLDSVFVTRNEVDHAGSHLRTELVVVDRIETKIVHPDGWTLRGGRLRHWGNWKPSEESLTAMQYSHKLSTPDLVADV